MTVSSTTSLTGPLAANGVTRDWGFTFKALAASDLVLIVDDGIGNVAEVTSSSFTVTGLGNDGGGSVQYPIAPDAPLAAPYKVTIERRIPYTQGTAVGNQGQFYPKTHETAWDRIVMMVQQVLGYAQASLRAPSADGAIDLVLPAKAYRASKFLAFDANGLPTASGATDPSNAVARNGDTMTGPLVLPGNPVSALQAAVKQYVDVPRTNAMLATMAASTLKGRSVGTPGAPEDLTPTQAHDVLGTGWRPHQKISIASNQSTIDIPWPASAKAMRINGRWFSTVTASNGLFLRAAYDAVPTFISTAGAYRFGYDFGSGSAASSASADATQANVGLGTGNLAMPGLIKDLVIWQGGSSPSRFPAWRGDAAGGAGSATSVTNGDFSGYMLNNVALTYVRLYPETGQFAAGTELLVEAYY